MKKPAQLPLLFPFSPALSREDFIVSPANAEALAYVERWPDWTAPVAGLYGPAGCGKTHLASIWRTMSGAQMISAREVGSADIHLQCARVIEDIDAAQPTEENDSVLFAAMQMAAAHAPLLLTGLAPPPLWPSVLPDLASRFSALIALPLRIPDEAVLAGLAHKLFADRQLPVPDEVIAHMLLVLERSPAALRDFVAEADAAALADGCPVNLSLVSRLLDARAGGS